MSEATEAPSQPGSLWWRLLWVGPGMGCLIALVSIILAMYSSYQAEQKTRAQMEALDAEDPDWRLDDLMRKLPEVPAEKNSAPRIVAIWKSMPKGWPDYKELERMNDSLQPNHRFGEKRLELLKKLLADVKEQRVAARKLVNYPRGRHNLRIDDNPIMTLLEDQQNTRHLAQLLDLDALGLAQEGDIKGALVSARACINAGNAMEHEPFLISALIRIAIHSIAMKNMERALALGEADDASLKLAQDAVWPIMRSPNLVLAMRGERAAMDKVARLIAEGKFAGKELEGMVRDGPVGQGQPQDWAVGAWNWVMSPNWQTAAQRERPEMLRFLTKAVENAKLPPEKQAAAEAALDAEVKKNAGRFVRLLMPATHKVAEAGRRGMAYALSMHTLLGCERYRLKHGKWPAKLEDLVPAYIPALPKDPFDGKPLRFKAWADGVVVYSIGKDGSDDGGDVALRDLKDFGYRLWDVKKRRQPAPKLPEPEGVPGPPPPP